MLNDEQKKQLEASLEKKFKKKVLASYFVSPHLIGGFSIKTDGHCWDISFRAQLKQLEKVLIPHY